MYRLRSVRQEHQFLAAVSPKGSMLILSLLAKSSIVSAEIIALTFLPYENLQIFDHAPSLSSKILKAIFLVVKER